MGWYVAGADLWMVEGSPSDWRIIRFMSLPNPLP